MPFCLEPQLRKAEFRDEKAVRRTIDGLVEHGRLHAIAEGRKLRLGSLSKVTNAPGILRVPRGRDQALIKLFQLHEQSRTHVAARPARFTPNTLQLVQSALKRLRKRRGRARQRHQGRESHDQAIHVSLETSPTSCRRRLTIGVRTERRDRDAHRPPPLIEHVEHIGLAILDASRPAARTLGMVAFTVAIDPPVHELQRHTPLGPGHHPIERWSDEAYQVTAVLTAQIRFDVTAILREIHRVLDRSWSTRRGWWRLAHRSRSLGTAVTLPHHPQALQREVQVDLLDDPYLRRDQRSQSSGRNARHG